MGRLRQLLQKRKRFGSRRLGGRYSGWYVCCYLAIITKLEGKRRHICTRNTHPLEAATAFAACESNASSVACMPLAFGADGVVGCVGGGCVVMV